MAGKAQADSEQRIAHSLVLSVHVGSPGSGESASAGPTQVLFPA